MRVKCNPRSCYVHSPSNIQDSINWFKTWSSGKTGYLPDVLQKEFAVPKAAFNCPGPDEKYVVNDLLACML